MEDWDWDTGGLDPGLLYSGSELGFDPDTFYGGLSPDLMFPEFNLGDTVQGFNLSGDLGTAGSFNLSELMNWGPDVGLGGDLSTYIPETTYTEELTPFVPRDVDVLSGYVPSGSPSEEELKEQFWKSQFAGSGIAGGATATPGSGVMTIGKDGTPVIKYPDGSTKTITTPGKDTTNTITKTIQEVINRTTGGKDNTQLLAALIGGLMSLLGKTNKPRDVGYQGGIPKYTAERVPGQGVKYTRAAGGGLMDLAGGGLMDLAGGGRAARYLRGGTDGMADKIKTDIDGKQPARLSHGEFVIPADVVSHLGNGNSDAGADVLYDMMAKIRKARTGTTKQGKQINPRKYTPA